MEPSAIRLLVIRYGVLLIAMAAWSFVLARAGVAGAPLFGIAVLMGFLVGLRWRMLLHSQSPREEDKAMTWSGASTGAYVALVLVLAVTKTPPSVWLIATFLIALEALYLAGKTTCALTGCCNATRAALPFPLPTIEAASAAAVMLAAAVALRYSPLLAVVLLVHIQYVVRLASRFLRERLAHAQLALETAQVLAVDLVAMTR